MSFRDLPPFRDLGAFIRVPRRAPAAGAHRRADQPRPRNDGGPSARSRSRRPRPRVRQGRGRAARRMPVVANLFGTAERVAAGFGVAPKRIVELGEMLAALREPSPFDGMARRFVAAGRWSHAALSTRPQPRLAARLPGRAPARRRRRPRPTADPDLLAGRAGAADHLGAGDHPPARLPSPTTRRR